MEESARLTEEMSASINPGVSKGVAVLKTMPRIAGFHRS